ncbi:MAG: WbqC family protein [Cytophagales bacterium]|nr:WbqC family protein [Cytophagales bacterium]
MIFTPNFLPSVLYFTELIKSESINWDQNDLYLKQSYRNRAKILGANKVENLIIPVHASSGKTPIKEVQIDNHSLWQRTQLRTIEAAYRNSPFYQYYDYLFVPIFEKDYKYLVDIQLDALSFCLKAMNLKKELNWVSSVGSKARFNSSPKDNTENLDFQFISYNQTFGNVFVPNLSIIDLLFNKGPETVAILINQAGMNTP